MTKEEMMDKKLLDAELLQEKRKIEHLRAFEALQFSGSNGFEQCSLYPVLFPEKNLNQIDTTTELFGHIFSFPLLIDAITGGFPEGDRINGILCHLAETFGLPMAVGSQSIALRYPKRAEGYRRLREAHPAMFLIGNISASMPPEAALKAIEMIEADALQLHVNPVQELAMAEGDRDFSGILKNISDIVRIVNKPVILKGVGAGMDSEGLRKGIMAGIQGIDLGGVGGTDFAKIENYRTGRTDGFLENFGYSTFETLNTALLLRKERIKEDKKPPFHIIASGGMHRPMDGLKAIIMGADFIGVSGGILRAVMEKGEPGGAAWLENYIQDYRKGMLLIGKREG